MLGVRDEATGVTVLALNVESSVRDDADVGTRADVTADAEEVRRQDEEAEDDSELEESDSS